MLVDEKADRVRYVCSVVSRRSTPSSPLKGVLARRTCAPSHACTPHAAANIRPFAGLDP